MAASKKLSLGIIFASATLTIMAGSIIAPVLNLMRDGLGIAPSSVGLIITTHGLFMALFSPLMGSIIDYRGVRRPYIAALFLYGLAGGSGLLVDSFWAFLIGRACLGIGLAGVFAGINVLILNMYDGIERDRVMGWRGTAQSFGGVIWPLIGGALGTISWRFPFAVYMVAIPIVVFLPQLLEGFGISSSFRIGLFITAMTGSAGVTAFVYGKIRSRFSYERIVLMAVVLWTLAFSTISQAHGSRLITVAVALFGISQGLIMPTVMVWVGAVVPPSFRGRFSSYLGTFGFIGQFLSPILFAPVFMLLGFKGVFLSGAGVGAVWFVLLIAIMGSARKIKTKSKGD
jgi:ACDE family multidrug resistance protein